MVSYDENDNKNTPHKYDINKSRPRLISRPTHI